MRLARAVDRERIVLEGIELRHDAEPRRLGEGGEHRRQGGDADKAREGRDADHRRDQDQAVGPRQPLVVDGIEGVLHRQRAAVGEADDMERPRRANAPASLADGKTGRGVPVLPFDVGQGRRHGAVARHPDRHGDEAAVAIGARDVAQAVRRIGQPVQQDDGADRGPVGLEDVGAVPVLREVAGIDRAAGVVAVARCPRLLVELVDDICPDLAKDRLLGLAIGGPVGLVDVRGMPVVRHVGVPRIERRPTLGIPGADGKQRCRDHDQQHENAAKQSQHLAWHRDPVGSPCCVVRSGGPLRISGRPHRVCIIAHVLGRTEWSGDARSTKGRVADHKMPA